MRDVSSDLSIYLDKTPYGFVANKESSISQRIYVKARLTDVENKLVVGGRCNIRVGQWEVQTVKYKIGYMDILYNTENIANIL